MTDEHFGSQLLRIEDLHAEVAGRTVLKGIDLEVGRGQVHVVMGPNGSGKSTLAHALMGRPGIRVTRGRVSIDGTDLLDLDPWQRAQAGLFLSFQQPVAVPGVRLEPMLVEALVAASAHRAAGGAQEGHASPSAVRRQMEVEAEAIGYDVRFLDRPVNVDLSGGERKRNEMVQLGVLRPPFCVLDEIDSGLDVDALGLVARRLEAATADWGLGVLAVTHFRRLLVELRADRVHVLIDGRIVASGGAELADELERTGYAVHGTS